MSTEVDAREALKAYVKKFTDRRNTQADAASSLAVSQQYLSDLLNGRRGFSDRLLKKLGLRKAVVKE